MDEVMITSHDLPDRKPASEGFMVDIGNNTIQLMDEEPAPAVSTQS